MAYQSSDFTLRPFYSRTEIAGYEVILGGSSRISLGPDGHSGDAVLATVPTTAAFDTFVSNKVDSSWTGNPVGNRYKGIDW